MGDGDLGRTSVLRHKIDTGDAAPIHSPRLLFHQRGLVQIMIKGMLDQGIVEPAAILSAVSESIPVTSNLP